MRTTALLCLILILNAVFLITDALPWMAQTLVPLMVIGLEVLLVLALLLDHIQKSLSDAYTIELGKLEIFVYNKTKEKSNPLSEYTEDTLKNTGT